MSMLWWKPSTNYTYILYSCISVQFKIKNTSHAKQSTMSLTLNYRINNFLFNDFVFNDISLSTR